MVIEHNLDLIKTADYIIDLGPEGGDEGGQIVATGTPEQVAKVEKSYTGQYLKKYLSSINVIVGADLRKAAQKSAACGFCLLKFTHR